MINDWGGTATSDFSRGLAATTFAIWTLFGQEELSAIADGQQELTASSVGVAVAMNVVKPAKVAKVAKVCNNANVAQSSLLKEHLRQSEKYGKGGIKDLENGRTRYYGELIPAKKSGEMAGRRTVREWDPVTGNKRTWHETLDHNGNVRQVRPEFNDGTKKHYTFDRNGNYMGSW